MSRRDVLSTFCLLFLQYNYFLENTRRICYSLSLVKNKVAFLYYAHSIFIRFFAYFCG